MCANFCGFRKRIRPNETESETLKCGLTASVMKMLKPRSIWTAMKAKKRQLHPPETQSCKVSTLEDLILASPVFCTNISGGESMPMHKQSSKKIHPSFDGDLKLEPLPKSGFCVVSRDEAKKEEKAMERANTSFGSTKSGKDTKKKKKKVSFRSPEVADVFVLDYPLEMCM